MKCPICLINNSSTFVDLGLQPFSHKFEGDATLPSVKEPLIVNYCENCSHFFNGNPIYSEFKDDYEFLTSASQTLIEESKFLANYLIEYYHSKYFRKPNSILEIASNDGSFLQEFDNNTKYSKILGVEPSYLAYKKSIDKGHNVLNEYFNSQNINKILDILNGFPELIVAKNVITHIDKIQDFFAGIEKVMSKYSILFLQCHYWPSLVENTNFDAIYHENYQYFTYRVLEKFMKKFGIQTIASFISESQGGSLAIIASKNEKLKKDISRKVIENEKIFFKNLDMKKNKFIKSLDFYKRNFIEFIKERQKMGIDIYGYGAPQKAVILLNYFNLNNQNIKLVADISSEKQNKFVPGTNIKICSPEYLITINAKLIIVFAWNYFDEIKKQMINMGSKAEIISIEFFKEKVL